ncbi:MAG: toll/interleukin-1 receptor domain-containing protein [Nitrospiraceae bacterium]
MSKILISYRREDSADVTGRMYDRLILQFDRESVFKDVDSIPLGVDFRTHLDEHVARCQVFLAVIGRDWMKTKGAKGKSRLEDPRDFVRIEIESALKRGIPLIPVLVGGASIPPADRLPKSIEDLAYRHGIAVRPDPDFHRDMDRLIDYLKKQIQLFEEHPTEQHTKVQVPGGDLKKTESVRPRVEPQSSEAPAGMVKVPKGPFLYEEQKRRDR